MAAATRAPGELPRRLSAHLASPRAAYRVLGLLTAGASAIVLVIGRDPVTTRVAAAALLAQSLLFFTLTVTQARRPGPLRRIVQGASLALVGLLTGVVGWFFGPNAGFASYVALACVVAGLLTGAAPVSRPTLLGWVTYLALATGQAAAFGLVLARVIPDRSLTIVIIAPHPDWQHALSHFALQVIFAAAFLSGRALQRRYHQLATQLIETLRAAARRTALAKEARLEYRRALAAGRESLRGAATFPSAPPPPPPPPPPASGPPTAEDQRLVGLDVTKAAAPSSLGGAARLGAADSLAAVLARQGALPAPEVARLASELATALGALHRRGGLHLEVRPSMVVRDSSDDPSWRLLEVGARLSADPPIRWLAPERLVGLVADQRADVCGMAATLYTATTGREPYAEVEPAQLAAVVPHRLPVDPRSFTELADDLELVLRRGLARDPEQRFADVVSLCEAMHAALQGELSDIERARARRLPPFAAVDDRGSRSTGETAATVVGAATDTDTMADAEPRPRPSPRPTAAPGSADPWRLAYRAKMRAFTIGITVFCAFGAALLGIIAREPRPLHFAWAAMAAIVIVAWLHWAVERRRAQRPAYWSWSLIGLLSVGPAYSFGLHSGFAAVVTTWLFAGGIFRTGQTESRGEQRAWVVAAIVLAHSAVFAAIMLGWLGDDGNVAVRQIGTPPWATVTLHVLLMGAHLAAYLGGRAVDGRFGARTRQAEEAVRRLAREDAALAVARAELGRLRASDSTGIFANQSVGPYQLGRVLGRGGMGEVYDATDTDSGRRVALKVVRPDRVADPLYLRLFVREVAALRKVCSPRVAQVLAVADIEQALPYIAMEYVDGESLAEILRQHERLGLDATRQMLRHIARGLEDVHACGIVHCDIKPSNLIRTHTRAPVWKIVDFGVAKPLDLTTAPAAAFGTPAYMSPEQLAAEPVDARADLFSLSLVLYRSLTGRPAFTGILPEDFAATMAQAGPPDPREYADLPDDVALALAIGLALRRDDRYASAGELLAGFEQAADGRLDRSWRARAMVLLQQRPWRRDRC